MKFVRRILSLIVLGTLVQSSLWRIDACGPSYIEPVFLFDGSPDIPFMEFTGGNIGIIRPTFGRKALFIAYRYANGGGFSANDQVALIEALRGKPPEENNEAEAVKAWIETRKLVVSEETLPEIYTDRNFGGYNFFPNCTKNAFEVAVETLNDRIVEHGASDASVREWLKGQDLVFEICSSGTTFPPEAGVDSPAWLKKDRRYQIAAAHFYALNFDEARRRFEEIAADSESVWQATADYLVGRTLVRQASLTKDEDKKRELHELAELHLDSVIRRSGRFGPAAQQLIGLVKYRSRPKERLHELAQNLTTAATYDLRQDLIDYAWLLDKFEAEVIEQVRKRREEQAKKVRAVETATTKTLPDGTQILDMPKESQYERPARPDWEVRREAQERGEIITLAFSYKKPDQTYPEYFHLDFKPDVTDDTIIRAFEQKLDRRLTSDEISKLLESKKDALAERRRYLGANFRFGQNQPHGYEGIPYSSEELTLDLVPAFIRVDDLSDWIFTFQMRDSVAYGHSLKRWRSSGLPAWLMSALVKAKKDSPEVTRLIEDASKVARTAPAFPTVAYHVVRLYIELGRTDEARKLLDELIASNSAGLPVSTRNQLFELRMRVSRDMGEFLRFAGRRPVAFSEGNSYGWLRDFLESEKSYWNEENYEQSREDYIRDVEVAYRDLLPWDDQVMFDERTVDIFNRHFPLDVLAQAAVHPELPEHLRRRLVSTVWTRAVVLGRRDVSLKFANQVMKQEPEIADAFRRYLAAGTEAARRTEELWILIKNPKLTTFVKSGIPGRGENEISSWEDGWWAEPSEIEYDEQFNEVPKTIPRPSFVTAPQSAAAMRERRQIFAGGNAETYLTLRILEWAQRSPRDPRVPEALYIAAVSNLETKYGAGNQEFRDRALTLLKTRYPNNPWTAKAQEEEF